MTKCKQEVFEFQGHKGRKVSVDFEGGHLSSDGGGVFVRELALKTGILGRLAGCFADLRIQPLVEHSVKELVTQRVGALALGYEDLIDHDRLRLDPLLAMMAGKKDVLGEDRHREEDKGRALAAHSTLNRLELGALGGDGRYKKIIADAGAIEALLIEEGIKAIRRRSREVVLDFDATDDPLHGQQEGAFFHGYYRNYCYLPLYCFCGTIPLWTQLRDAKRDGSEGTVAALKKIVPAIRRRFGRKVRLIHGAEGFFEMPRQPRVARLSQAVKYPVLFTPSPGPNNFPSPRSLSSRRAPVPTRHTRLISHPRTPAKLTQANHPREK